MRNIQTLSEKQALSVLDAMVSKSEALKLWRRLQQFGERAWVGSCFIVDDGERYVIVGPADDMAYVLGCAGIDHQAHGVNQRG